MPQPVVVAGSSVSCPHGGVATAQGTAQRVQSFGTPLVLVTDQAAILGCPFQIPVPGGTKPSPCGRIQWSAAATRVQCLGSPLLLQNPAGSGTCLSPEQAPQAPAIVTFTFAGVPPGTVLAT